MHILLQFPMKRLATYEGQKRFDFSLPFSISVAFRAKYIFYILLAANKLVNCVVVGDNLKPLVAEIIHHSLPK